MSSSKKSKICLFLPSFAMGGAERLSINLANEWHEDGYEVELVIIKNKTEVDLSSKVLNGIKISYLKQDRLFFSIPSIINYLRSSKPDISLVAMWPLTIICTVAWLLSRKIGKLFLSEHTQLSISMLHEFNTHKFIVRTSIYLFYNLADGVIAVSKGVKEDLCDLGFLSPRAVKIIYNPASFKKYPEDIEDSDPFNLIWDNPGKKILAVGTLKKQKDFKTLVRAINKVSYNEKISVAIIGEGPERKEIQKTIDKYGLSDRIHLVGFVMDPLKYFYYADLFVLSSAWEGFGNVIVEALESGTQVVSTNCKSGPAEILENGKFGTLVPIKDPKAMAQAIDQSLINDYDPEPLIERAKLFSVDRIAKEYIDYFLIQR